MTMLAAIMLVAQATPGADCPDVYEPGIPAECVVEGMAEFSEDELAIGETLTAVYAVISGPAGQERDWDAMRIMFTEDARLYAAGRDGQLRGGTLDDYIARSGPFLVRNGFIERELARRVEIYGAIAHAWSSYEGTYTSNGEPQTIRGINSFQLHRQEDGSWKVHSIFWQAEQPDLPLPTDMEAQ